MTTPGVPQVPWATLRDLAKQASQQTLSRASLEAAASNMKVSLGELLNALKGAAGGPIRAGAIVKDTASSLAKTVYSAIGELPEAAELAKLQLQAARQIATSAVTAGEVASTAGEAASTVATGGRILGAVTRIGSFFGLSGAAATAAGVVTLLGAAGLLGAVVGTAAGSFAGDDPVEPGAAINGPHPTRVAVATPGAAAVEPYSVWLLTNLANGSIWVGQESALEGTMTCNWPGGGLCADAGWVEVPLTYEQKLGPYTTYEGAVAAFCGAITDEPEYWAIANGTKAQIFGAKYWIDTGPSCP